MPKTKHTPLPWGFDGDGFDSVSAQLCDTDGYAIFPLDEDGDACGHIAEMSEAEGDDEAEANAAFIVLAVNNHYSLLDAIKVLLAATDEVDIRKTKLDSAQKAARTAIAKATGAAS